jgi:chromosome segregation ATPase
MLKKYCILITISFIVVSLLFLYHNRTVILPDDAARIATVTDNISGQSIRIAELESQLADSNRTIRKFKSKLAEYERTNKQLASELLGAKSNSNGISNTITSISGISTSLEEGQRGIDDILESVYKRGTITVSAIRADNQN